MDEEFDYFKMAGKVMPAKHDFSKDGRVCQNCECAPGYMTTECCGHVLTAYQKERVGSGRLDFRVNDVCRVCWVPKIIIPRFVGTFEEVTAFLNAELAAG